MNYYLVDFENVGANGIRDLKNVEAGDEIILFYSDQCKSISLDLISSMTRRKVRYNSFKAKNGTKNALDFLLAAHLGYLIGQKAEEVDHYYIVSNDKGYDCLCDYWQDMGAEVERISLIGDPQPVQEEAREEDKPQTKKPKKGKVNSSDLATLEEVKALLEEEDEPETILEIFNSYKTKQAICNGMAKRFKDNNKTSAIYKKLKPLLKDKNKT